MKAISVSLCLAQLENAARRGADRSAATLGSNANFYGVGYTGLDVQSQACEHGQVEEHLRLMSLRMMMANTSLVWMQTQVLKVGSVIPMSTISSQSHTTSFVLS